MQMTVHHQTKPIHTLELDSIPRLGEILILNSIQYRVSDIIYSNTSGNLSIMINVISLTRLEEAKALIGGEAFKLIRLGY